MHMGRTIFCCMNAMLQCVKRYEENGEVEDVHA